MEKKDIEHLAKLARIEVTETEGTALAGEISEILGYVGEISEITADREIEKSVGSVYNVFRKDADPHEADAHTETLLDAAPERTGRYIQVKKILSQDE